MTADRNRKNVVIIGLGAAAINLAHALEKTLPATHRIVIITESDAAYNAPASVRAAIVPGWESKVVAPAAALFPKNSPHIVLASTKVLQISDHSVLVDVVHPGFGEQIDFDYAVLATGSTYGNAFQPRRGMTKKEITTSFVESQAYIKSAHSILIAGAGPTGIELAGEIKALHPSKKVTIVSAGPDFTPTTFSPKLGKSLASQLKAVGVEVHFNTRLDTGEHATGPIPTTFFPLPAGGAVEADFLIVAYGSKPNSELMQALDPSAVSSRGYVRINKSTLQVKGHPTLFAVGDVADTPDLKTAIATMSHAPVAAANIVSLIAGKKATKEWAPAMKAIMISFGPNKGAGQLPLPVFGVVGPWFTAKMKSKSMFIDKWQAEFKH